MPRSDEGMSGIGDVAVLAAGVVAATVAIFLIRPPYDLIEATVSLTLSVVIAAYVLARERTLIQSVAVAAVLALAFLPLAAFGIETVRADEPVHYFWWGYPVPCDKNACDAAMAPATRVSNGLHFLIWAVAAIVFFALDRVLPRAIRP